MNKAVFYVLGLSGFLALTIVVGVGIKLVEQERINANRCVSLKNTFCIKTATCFEEVNYQDCMALFDEPFGKLCEQTDSLDIQACDDSFKQDVKCDGNLPETCSFLQ